MNYDITTILIILSTLLIIADVVFIIDLIFEKIEDKKQKKEYEKMITNYGTLVEICHCKDCEDTDVYLVTGKCHDCGNEYDIIRNRSHNRWAFYCPNCSLDSVTIV